MPVTEFKLQYQSSAANFHKTSVIIVAAGNSVRMGSLKQFMDIGNKPLILRTILPFEKSDLIQNIIVVSRQEDVLRVENLVTENNISKITDIVAGGDTRAESVYKGFERCDKDTKYILIHDGARPFVTQTLISKVLEGVELYGAVACAVPVKDTIKETETCGRVHKTLDRSKLYAVQTPQAIEYEKYLDALNKAAGSLDIYTDDCSIVENAGYPVYLVEGDYRNIKITTPEDIVIANALLREYEDINY
ncbi:MAG TPA: 2-C-methyl-D-erythritol 4-phosphate cytidylyltransferase [Clostridiales bacterium]|nr:2-C-methyl-D-erythritol 4-phosphate cytidylyltransferase [Clostridiales bacterium]